MKPRIGITMGRGADGTFQGPEAYLNYSSAVEEAGGEAVFLGGDCRGREREVVRGLQGLLLSGGWDIDLRHYPRPPDLEGRTPEAVMEARNMTLDQERDLYELPLTREAIEADLPVFGICRGCQTLNVALGGQLILDIPSQVPGATTHRAAPPPHPDSAWHALRIEPGSLLARILPPERHVRTNSRHHQALLANEHLAGRVTALSPEDEIIEAIEIPGRRFALGVQWHPEYRHDAELRAAHRPLFAVFVAACEEG
jgi:putative glutamine amidotransferase